MEGELLLVFLGEVLGVFFIELLNPPCRVDKLLLAGKKRMACGTDLDMNLLFDRSEFKFAAAGALCHYLVVLRVYVGFHCLRCLRKTFSIR